MLTRTPFEHEISRSLAETFDALEMVDSHEHLRNEEIRLAQKVDFSTLFSHYCVGELTSAGMSKADMDLFLQPEGDAEHKWRVFHPYYEQIKNGGYARAARTAMGRFYGLDDLTSAADAIDVSARMKEANVSGLYRRILTDECRFKTTLVFNGEPYDREFFRSVHPINHLCDIACYQDLENDFRELGAPISTRLSDYVEAVGVYLASLVQEGAVGFKFTTAYYRNLDFQPTTDADAERIYNRVFERSLIGRNQYIDSGQTLVLSNYLTHRIIGFAQELGVPVAFHTGLQAGNRNNPDLARPERLWNLFYQYPRVKFVILHAGLPWIDEAAMLAKYYPNVYLDMAWMHVISSEMSVAALKTWVDFVPRNKVMGFGGDYTVVEKVYGHLMAARGNIIRALTDKIESGAMSERDGHAWIKSLLRETAIQVYRLD